MFFGAADAILPGLGVSFLVFGFGRIPIVDWMRGQANESLAHAQEMEPEVVRQHIELYVNEFSRELGEEGRAAVERLLGGAARLGLVPETGMLAR
jgi:hypothetical protein